MCFRRVYDDSEFQLPLLFEGHVADHLYRLVSQSDPPETAARNRKELAERIVERITAMLEGEALPPTAKQVKYAVAIARELSIELPAQALQHRDSKTAFIGRHAPQYRQRKGFERSD